VAFLVNSDALFPILLVPSPKPGCHRVVDCWLGKASIPSSPLPATTRPGLTLRTFAINATFSHPSGACADPRPSAFPQLDNPRREPGLSPAFQILPAVTWIRAFLSFIVFKRHLGSCYLTGHPPFPFLRPPYRLSPPRSLEFFTFSLLTPSRLLRTLFP